MRLYRKDRGRYAASPVHDRVALEPGVTAGRLKGVIHHFSVRSLGDQLDKLNRYSDQQADDLEARGVTIPDWRVFVELPGNFLKAYLGRRHFVRGTYGFLTAMNYAISRHLRIAKHVERRRVAAARRDRVDPARLDLLEPERRRRGRAAEGTRLLNEHTQKWVSRVRIPPSPPFISYRRKSFSRSAVTCVE